MPDGVEPRAPGGSTVRLNDVGLFVEDRGLGSEAIVFSHGLLFSARMFEAQVSRLSQSYRCIAYDHRGQGRSERPPEGTIDIETVYRDAVALVERLSASPCHFVGLSMGGFVGLRLAARRPDLLRSLVLLETSAETEPALFKLRLNLMALVVRLFGTRPVFDATMNLMFGPTFRTDPARASEWDGWRAQLRADVDRSILPALRGVIHRAALTHDELQSITVPTLVIGGAEDRVYPPAATERLQASIPGSRLAIIPAAGHSPTIEQPDAVTQAIADFVATRHHA